MLIQIINYYSTNINCEFSEILIFLYHAVSMDYVPLSMDLTFSDTISNECVNLATIFNADTNAMPFNVKVTTMEPPTAVILSPQDTNITILDGRQFSSSIFHSLNLPQYIQGKKLISVSPSSLKRTKH